MEPVLRQRLLAVVGLRLVLAFLLFMGMGAVSLWPLVLSSGSPLGLDAGPGLGTFLGLLARNARLLRLGAVAARGAFFGWHRLDVRRSPRGIGLRVRDFVRALHVRGRTALR